MTEASKTPEAMILPTTALATLEETGILPLFGEKDYNLGFENVEPEEYQLPGVIILQSNTRPVLDRKGFAGEWFNTLTEECYGPSIDVIPVYYFKQRALIRKGENGAKDTIECRSADAVTGDIHGDCLKCRFNKWAPGPNGERNKVPPVCTLYKVFPSLVPGALFPLRVRFKRTALPAARDLINIGKTKGQPRPLFGSVFRLTTELTQNSAGQNWFVPVVNFLGYPTKTDFEQARRCYEILRTMRFEVETDPDDTVAPEAQSPAGAGSIFDDPRISSVDEQVGTVRGAAADFLPSSSPTPERPAAAPIAPSSGSARRARRGGSPAAVASPALTPEERTRLIEYLNEAPVEDAVFEQLCKDIGIREGQLLENTPDAQLAQLAARVNVEADAAE